MKEFIHRYTLPLIIGMLGLFLFALLTFATGMSVGFHKAMYSYRWDDSYSQQFGGPRSPFMMGGVEGDRVPNPHGAVGTVISMHLPSFVIKGPSESERIVIVGTSTIFRRFHDLAASTTVNTGDTVVIIGNPDNEGRIVATLVRIMPKAAATSTRGGMMFR